MFNDITNLKKEETHFLGSIVVVPEKKDGPLLGAVNYFQLVDGQQRLTTIFIWLSVLRDIAKENNNDSLAIQISDTLFAEESKEGKKNKISKIQLGKLDEEIFNKVVEGELKDQTHQIAECYQFFKNKTDPADIDDLVEKIIGRISIVHINAFSYFNAFRLFETLNDRGLELSAFDLIKNFVLMKISSNPSLFEEVISEWNEMYEKIQDLEPVTFLRRYMLSQFKGKVTNTKLYEEIKKKIEDNKVDVLEFISDLNLKASIYQKINKTTFNSNYINFNKINKRLQELQLIEVSPSYSLLLNVFSLNDNKDFDEELKVFEENILEILRLIGTFHIRWGVCGLSTSKLDPIYNNINELILKTPSTEKTSDNYLKIIKGYLTNEIRLNANNELFKRSFVTKLFSPTEKRTKYILWKLSNPTGELKFDVDEVQTEHIMPQKLSNDWIEYLKQNSGFSEDTINAIHKDKINLIGNLTLIRGDWNQGMSNSLFEVKKDYYKNSDFKITDKLLKCSQWKFNQIDERSRILGDTALEIWDWKYSEIYIPNEEKNYWLVPTRYKKFGTTSETIKALLGEYKIFGYRENTPGRKIIKPGDLICIYEAGNGIVADAEVASYPEKFEHPALDFDTFPWVFNLKNVNFYFDKPIFIVESLRTKLDAFDGKKSNNWAWFVQSAHKLSKNDFFLLKGPGEKLVDKEQDKFFSFRQLEYKKFWDNLVEDFSKENQDFGVRDPYPQTFMNFGSGISGVHYQWAFRKINNKNKFSIELEINSSDVDVNKRYFEHLYTYKEELELKIKNLINDYDELEFYNKEENKKKVIRIHQNLNNGFMDLSNNQKDKLILWGVCEMIKFREVFDPFVKELNYH